MINPPQCGEAPLSFEWPAFVAGLHRLRINAGEVARPDLDKARAYCQTLHEQTRRGAVRDDTVYVVHPRFVEPLQQAARVPFGCTTVDGLAVCVTGATRHLWNGTAFSGSGPQ